PVPGSELEWDELRTASTSTVGLVEASTTSASTVPPDEVAELAADIAAEGAPVGETALEICRAVGSAMEYMRGVTGVHSTAAEAWDERKGVCQDIAHVALGAL